MPSRRGVNIGQADRRDVARIAEIHRAARSRYYRAAGYEPDPSKEPDVAQWEQYLSQVSMRLACARIAETTVGFACAYEGQEASRGGLWSLELVALYVDPEHWNSGVGALLHEWYMKCLERSTSAKAGTLYVWSLNHRAVGFYARRGWQRGGLERPGPLNAPFISMRLDRTTQPL